MRLTKLPISQTTSLNLLRSACLSAAAPDFSCSPKGYCELVRYRILPSKLYGHCAAVSYVVLAVFGGHIVTGRVKGIQHYWNRLPDGKEVDLTSCQFGGDGFTPLAKGRKVKPRKHVPLRFLMFMDRVRERLGHNTQERDNLRGSNV